MSLEGGNGRRQSGEQYPYPEVIAKTVAKLERSAHEFSEEYPDAAIWLHDHLNAIKVRGLQGAFKNVIESVHGTFDPERVVSPERTYIVKEEGREGAHFLGVGITKINGMSFVGLEKELSLMQRAAKLLDLVCHENAHAVGKISFSISPDGLRTETGYSTGISAGSSRVTVGLLLEEGVTELVSQRVAREYLIGYPMVLEDGSILDVEQYEHFLETYHLESGTPENNAVARDFVRALSRHVAQALFTTPELVEDAFVAGFFLGTEEYFEDPDFLDVVLGVGFSERIRNATSADDLKKIVQDYQMPPITSAVQEKIERMLMSQMK